MNRVHLTRAFLAVAVLGLALQPSWALQPAPKADDLATGIRQVEEGDLEGAVITLDAAVRRLSGQPGQEKELATAHLYLAMTHLGLSQLERAKADLREAWRNDRQLTLDPKRFPPRLIEIYEQTKQEAAAQATAKPAPPRQAAAAKPTPASPPPAVAARPSPTPKPATPAVASQPAPSKKGGGSKALWIGLGVAAVGGGVAAAAGGGGGGPSTPAPTPTPTPTTSPRIAFVSSVPPPGGTATLPPAPATSTDAVSVTVSVFVAASATARLELYFINGNNSCLNGFTDYQPFEAGRETTLTVSRFIITSFENCQSSFRTSSIQAELESSPSYDTLLRTSFPYSYTFVR